MQLEGGASASVEAEASAKRPLSRGLGNPILKREQARGEGPEDSQ